MNICTIIYSVFGLSLGECLIKLKAVKKLSTKLT